MASYTPPAGASSGIASGRHAHVLQHSLRGPLPGAHGQDDGGRAGHNIAAGEQTRDVVMPVRSSISM